MPETPNLEDAVEFAGNPKQPSPPRSPRLRRGWRRAAAIMAGQVLLAVLLPACNNSSPPAPADMVAVPTGTVAVPTGMVAVPAGEFFMGCNEQADTDCAANEKPGRMVYLDAFAIDTYEVTVAAYRKCVAAGECTAPRASDVCNWNKSDREDHPINCVDWNEADAYCRWAGKRLPTEAEWEKAARGAEGRVYPWGNEWDEKKANAGGSIDATVAVGSYPAGISLYGALDMSGNVWEWTADWYDSDYYQRQGPTRNPRGLNTGTSRSVRGGSWSDHPQVARASYRLRYGPGYRPGFIRLRCAQ